MGKRVYLTFQTEEKIAFILKDFAHRIGKTQPELIDEICRNYVQELIEKMQKGITSAEMIEDIKLEEKHKETMEKLDIIREKVSKRQ